MSTDRTQNKGISVPNGPHFFKDRFRNESERDQYFTEGDGSYLTKGHPMEMPTYAVPCKFTQGNCKSITYGCRAWVCKYTYPQETSKKTSENL